MERRFFNRDLSWLEFNKRVLHQARDELTPPLERIRFLAIFLSNLDEFFMKRVPRLKQESLSHPRLRGDDGMTARLRFRRVRQKVIELLERHADCYQNLVLPALSKYIHIVSWNDLVPTEKRYLRAYFKREIFPVLTPLVVDPSHPFPFLSNLSLSIGLRLFHPTYKETLFARVKLPDVLPPYLNVQRKEGYPPFRLIRARDVIRHHISELFPEMRVDSMTLFRVTRGTDLYGDMDDIEESDDLVDSVEEELRLRKMAPVIRLEYEAQADPWILNILSEELELSSDDLYEVRTEMNSRFLRDIAKLDLPDLKYKTWRAVTPPHLQLSGPDIFQTIERNDILIHHPYESFSNSLEALIRAAAKDPAVLAIKLTIYRIGDDSPLIPHLMEAARRGKHVVCVVEVKATFDEARNIRWGQELEQAGVHVVYGIIGLKTHAKLLFIARKEGEKLKTYAHIGTGNYNDETANLYTDLGLLTSNPKITSEIVSIFNHMTGLSVRKKYNYFLVAPINLKEKFLSLIEGEARGARRGKPSGIIVKMNSLEDRDICEALYRASSAGVSIKMIIRGFCCLRPGVSGLSDTIRVISVVGRFLEHSRLYYFRNQAEDPLEGKFYMGSADWMPRNLQGRMEAVVPILSRAIREECWEILRIFLNDRSQSWELQKNGEYSFRRPSIASGFSENVGCHDLFMRLYSHHVPRDDYLRIKQ